VHEGHAYFGSGWQEGREFHAGDGRFTFISYATFANPPENAASEFARQRALAIHLARHHTCPGDRAQVDARYVAPMPTDGPWRYRITYHGHCL